MAINVNSNVAKKGTFLTFVPLLGGLYVVDDETTAAIKAARAHSGAKQTDGYQGDIGDFPSAKALAFLNGKGVKSVFSVNGILRGVAYKETEHEGFTSRRIFVTLRDKDEQYTIACDASNPAVHMLLQKLVNVGLNQEVEISLLGSYEPNKNAPNGPSYSNYGASVKTIDGQVKMQNGAYDAVRELVKSLEQQLAAVPSISKEAIAAATRDARTNFFIEMAKKLQASMTEAREAEKAEIGHVEQQAEKYAPGDNFDDEPF